MVLASTAPREGLSAAGTTVDQRLGRRGVMPGRDHSIRLRQGRPGRRGGFAPAAVGLILVSVLAAGWHQSYENHLTPKSGTGYWLGIVGASMMLLLLLYPLRKRWRSLRAIGSVASWFRIHMVLGLWAPVLILLHANFSPGSLNSTAALLSMLAVALSGIVGRYLYAKLHMGLYGQRAEAGRILDELRDLKQVLGNELPGAKRIYSELAALDGLIMRERVGLVASGFRAIDAQGQLRRARRIIARDVRSIVDQNGKSQKLPRRVRKAQIRSILDVIDLYIDAVRRAVGLAFYERLFFLWHVLHVPLFVVLVLAAIVHVIAVHLY